MRKGMLAAITCLAGLAAGTSGAMTENASGLLVLNQSAQGALRMVGNSRVEIPARAVYVNSSHNRAVTTSGTATLDAPFLYVVGGADFGGNSGCTGQVIRSAAPYADPMAGLMFPTAESMPNQGSRSISGSQVVELSPGYYSGISVSGSSRVTFRPGVYLIGGSGLNISSGTIAGEGVTLLMAEGSLTIAGSSSLVLSPPETGDYANVVIAQSPTNTSAMSLAGGSEVQVSGRIYAPGAMLYLVGNSLTEADGPQIGDIVIADRVELRGTGTIRIGREDQRAIVLPKMPLYD